MKARTIPGSSIVVTGATSGVGRATALSLAAVGARLVIVARDEADLTIVAGLCRDHGASVVPVAADVSVATDVERIVAAAVDAYGHIDTWINAAAVLVVGELPQLPVDAITSLVSTNVIGATLQARAALTHFSARDAGVFVNVSSLLAIVPNPVVPAYVMTKFAILGLMLSLQQSIPRSSAIKVSTVLPAPIDTPMFERAANYSGRAIRAIPPAFSPERIAAAVVRSVKHPRRQRTTGLTGALIMIGHRVVPRLTETIVAQTAARLIFRNDTAPPTRGSLRAANVPTRTNGGWRRGRLRTRAGDAVGRRLARRA